ncbi:hypothetical protein ACFQGX_24450 [Nonomuraea dietziae]|uniref:hypothetical protein n=1 Tax=Nonomuraea dietziae TaxID=65515 RepID=UPI003607FEC3
MLAFALGLAWLVLSPLCLWILVRGRNPARLGAVLTLVAMEAATVLISQERESLVVVAHDAPAAARRPAAPDCSERAPVPQAARLGRRHEQLRLYWTAAPDECGTAEVLLRRRGRELRVWITEGTPQTRPSRRLPLTPLTPLRQATRPRPKPSFRTRPVPRLEARPVPSVRTRPVPRLDARRRSSAKASGRFPSTSSTARPRWRSPSTTCPGTPAT